MSHSLQIESWCLRDEKIAIITHALKSATLAQLDEVIQVLPAARKRLRGTLSADIKEENKLAEEMGLSAKQKKRRLDNIKAQPHACPASRVSAKAVLSAWTQQSKDYHPVMFLCTMYIRDCYGHVQGLRSFAATQDWTLTINGKPFYVSVLGRKLYENNLRKFDTVFFPASC